MTLPARELEALVQGEHEDVFAVLGPHAARTPDGDGVVVRAFLPEVDEARVVPRDARRGPRRMERVHPVGLFEAVFPGEPQAFSYRLEVLDGRDATAMLEDPYRFPSTLSD